MKPGRLTYNKPAPREFFVGSRVQTEYRYSRKRTACLKPPNAGTVGYTHLRGRITPLKSRGQADEADA